MNNHSIIINVGRQIGSGGGMIARKLAEEFGCTLYDKELLNLAAKESGFSERFFEENDEQKGFFKSLFHVRVPLVNENNYYHNNFSQESLFALRLRELRNLCETFHQSGTFINSISRLSRSQQGRLYHAQIVMPSCAIHPCLPGFS